MESESPSFLLLRLVRSVFGWTKSLLPVQ
jgi:hypothetical protein